MTWAKYNGRDMKMMFRMQVIVAELDSDGFLTGEAEETSPDEADRLCQTSGYKSFGTWEAFGRAVSADESLRNGNNDTETAKM